MIPAIIQNLNRGIRLLNSINDEEYSNNSTAPYYSSIGVHMRHILDVFNCVLKGIDKGIIDLSARQRNELAEINVAVGLAYFEEIQLKLSKIDPASLERVVQVKDDLGLGMVTANYTLAAALIQAHSHAIHHFASIGYIISQLGIDLPDGDFGYNPTTPRGNTVNK
ncbi:DinB family protein [Lutimonas saemankumensis]|uniref:DinB family protein n=1 Tax=Lutimonas saemankumensis TaxID=483016 RepID=UPI001CD59793|nr:DinB family protein [Lutimonas saemankumensis]MCA0932335.1 DinB family protein [Lutimonas saemankumensis]